MPVDKYSIRRMAPKLKSLDNADKLMGKKTQKDNNHTGTFSQQTKEKRKWLDWMHLSAK